MAAKAFDRNKVVVIFDHNTPAPNVEYANLQNEVRKLAKEFHLPLYDVGQQGLMHHVVVAGFDGVIIGTTDLSKSLGFPGQTNHPQVLEALEKVLAVGKKTGKVIGGVVRAGETPKQYIDKGFRIVLTGATSLLAAASKQFLASARS